MSDHSDYVDEIRKLNRDQLRSLWNRIEAGHTPGWPPGRAFEHLVLRAFELDGAEVVWPFEVYLDDAVVEQVDGAVYAGDLSCLVEAKDTSTRTDVGVLSKVRTALARRPSTTLGLVFSRTGFTSAAMSLARFFSPHTVLLWTGDEVSYLLNHGNMVAALRTKYRECVEQGIPYVRQLRVLPR